MPVRVEDNPEAFREGEKRVLLAIFVKLQREAVLQQDSSYRILAQRIVEEAAVRGYTLDDLNDLCKNYEVRVKVYGDRIEPAEFFSSFEPPKLYSYAWALAENDKQRGAMRRMDSYRCCKTGAVYFRYNDGNRYEIPGFVLVRFGGELTVDGAAILSGSPTASERGER